MFNNSWFKKEKPLPTLIGLGGGATGLSQSAVEVGATGGKIIKDPASGNTFHVFLEPGTFDPAGISGPTMGYLIAAGGGSGGRLGGGGGAGELVCRGSQPFSPGSTYAVVVGEGGAALTSNGSGNDGDPSSFNGQEADGGGGGGGYGADGESGGSGGGGGSDEGSPRPGGSATAGETGGDGNPGGNGVQYYAPSRGYNGGGGGGATEAGGGAGPGPGGDGGGGGGGITYPAYPAPVLAPAIPAPVRPAWTTAVGSGTFCGGGGGGNDSENTTVPVGGNGGGGNGSCNNNGSPTGTAATPAVDYTGSGGGGGRANTGGNPQPSGKGGDGIVIIHYTTP